VAGDGSFVVTPLYGDCLFDIFGVPPGWMPKALIVNGRDVLGTPVAFQDGETIAGARLVLTRRAPSVSVAAQDADGRPPAHDAAYIAIYRERSGRMPARVRWFGRAARDPARFAALPPGDYFAFASTTTAALGDFDSDALKVLRATGTSFSVREGETKGITVTMIPRWGR
jgi:hypothetical protein